MTTKEIIQSLELLKAEIEWEYSIEYQISLTEAIEKLKAVEEKIWKAYNGEILPDGDYYVTLSDELATYDFMKVRIATYSNAMKSFVGYPQGAIVAWKPKDAPYRKE